MPFLEKKDLKHFYTTAAEQEWDLNCLPCTLELLDALLDKQLDVGLAGEISTRLLNFANIEMVAFKFRPSNQGNVKFAIQEFSADLQQLNNLLMLDDIEPLEVTQRSENFKNLYLAPPVQENLFADTEALSSDDSDEAIGVRRRMRLETYP